jgi:RND superfamily putative drug exporter
MSRSASPRCPAIDFSLAVLFGLAMDYEVFLVSAMREDYGRRRDARGAVLAGARHASRVVTSAALIMISVFVSFFLGKDPAIMPIAFALAVGVLADAFLVRMTLVPAVLGLLGDRAWWLPHVIDRFLPRLDVEGTPSKPTVPRQPRVSRTPPTRQPAGVRRKPGP